MSENNTQSTATAGEAAAAAPQAPQEPAATGNAAEAKTFTQEEVNAIVEKRLARAKSTPPADYEELKAKAAKLDELEEANKTELERATDALGKANAAASEWEAKYNGLMAEKERAEAVAKAASEHGVDAELLARMAGDVDENAAFLAAQEKARPKFGDMHDGGEQPPVGQTLDDIRKIRNPQERIRARAQYLANNGQ